MMWGSDVAEAAVFVMLLIGDAAATADDDADVVVVDADAVICCGC